MKIFFLFIFFAITSLLSVMSQPLQSIKGKVIDKITRQPLEFINVQLVGFDKGAVTDSVGNFAIKNVSPGIYRLRASAVDYKTLVTPEYIVSNKSLNINIEVEENITELAGVTITASTFRRDLESPIGLRIIGLQEIEKSPGANRDISRIVQSYPGVAFSPAGYRNDLIVRGGAPSENRFFIDGIEIPNINHFSTQGASGGPVGIINADLIREVNFYTGALPANRGNALSSVLDFKLRDGDMDHNSIKATLGASEVSLASNGHIGKKTSYLVSVRQSYLQFLFDMIGLPFLPTFTDGQFKIKTRFNNYNELTVLGLAGIDNMRLNTKLDDEKSEYILSYLPKIQQETFTVGTVYRHYAENHVQSVVLSHSYLNNRNTKYNNNDESNIDNLRLKLRSIEQETKFRVENTSIFNQWEITAGINLDHTHFTNHNYQKIYLNGEQTYNYNTTLNMLRWGIFATVNYATLNERFTASLGLRADAANYSGKTNKLTDQISPRLSLSYRVAKGLFLSANGGIYYQLPPYTALGFKNSDNVYLNEALRYSRVSQTSVGFNWQAMNNFEISIEGFYKYYNHIPFSVVDGIPLACKGDDYGVIGNELLVPTAQGRSFGVELLARWIIVRKLNVASSLTFFKSEYRNDKNSPYIASAWDNRYIFNLSGTYSFPRNWSFGAKISSIGGAPFTPYDIEKSSLVSAWNAQGRPYYDYTRYNSGRLSAFTQLDIRVDKTYYIKKCMLGFYIDLQNVTKSLFTQPDILMSTGVIENPDAPYEQQRYVMKYIEQKSGTILPTLGITFQY